MVESLKEGNETCEEYNYIIRDTGLIFLIFFFKSEILILLIFFLVPRKE